MKTTRKVETLLRPYGAEPPGVVGKLARILMHGRLRGTGRMIILPVDQGVEHGPARSFSPNADGYDPVYHHRLAIEGGFNAYAAPLGALSVSAPMFPDAVPLILKVNHNNTLMRGKEDSFQATFADIEDALRLGCSAVGYTIYPGSDANHDMLEEAAELVRDARAVGLPTVLWSYPRGGDLTSEAETALDVVAYAAHLACQTGAHIIKVKLPSAATGLTDKPFPSFGNLTSGADRVAMIMKSCFDGQRLVVFSGGAAKDEDSVIDDARAIAAGGGHGSIIGRNCFQRPHEQALALVDRIVQTYKQS
ncbi:MAG: class I fructose-bisphosphate aldolase [Pseudomonadota bacterium]